MQECSSRRGNLASWIEGVPKGRQPLALQAKGTWLTQPWACLGTGSEGILQHSVQVTQVLLSSTKQQRPKGKVRCGHPEGTTVQRSSSRRHSEGAEHEGKQRFQQKCAARVPFRGWEPGGKQQPPLVKQFG